MLIAILIGFCLYCFSAFTGGVSDGVFSSPAEQSFFNALINGSLRQGIYWTALISSITLLILTLYIGTHSILRMAGRIHPMTLPKRLALIGGWIITAVIFIASMIQSSISYDWYIRDYREEQRIRNDSLEHQRQLSYLEHEGWKVVRHKECGNNYVKSGEYYTGNRDVQYIDAWNFNRKMEYEVERTVHVTPGIYRLEAAARTDGQGCEILPVMITVNGRLTSPYMETKAGRSGRMPNDSRRTEILRSACGKTLPKPIKEEVTAGV